MKKNKKKHILFLETGKPVGNKGVGGSLISLQNIVEGIDKKLYRIYILLYHNFDIINEYKKNDCKIILTQRSGVMSETKAQENFIIFFLRKCNFRLKQILLYQKFIKNITFIRKVKKIRNIISIIKKHKIDIIHCNNGLGFVSEGIIAAIFTGKACVVHQRNFEYKLPFMTKYFGKKVNKFIAISSAIKQNLIDEGKISNEKIEIIHNWINSKKIVASKDKKDKRFNILWIGRLIHWKGAHILIPLAELLCKYFDDFCIDIFGSYYSGSKDYFLKMKNDVKNYDLSKKINFMGYQNNKNIYSKTYDLFMHTSLEPEPFGRVIIEAMMNGIPVIATKKGGVLDIINDGENGFLYDPDNLQDLTKKIILIRNNFKVKQKFINNGYSTVETKFSEKGKVDKIMNIYDAI